MDVYLIGEGIPILFLHGWGTRGNTFATLAQALANQGFACHLLDLPGFGASPIPPEPWDVPRYAQFVSDYLKQADLETVNLVGHSFGGRISLVLGADYPQLVKKIALIDSAGVKPPPTLWTRAYYLSRKVIFTVLKIPPLRRFEPAVREWFRRRYGSSDYQNAGALMETFKRVIAQDLVGYARRIQAPTLLIWGDQDEDTPLRDAKILEAAIPDAGLVIFEGAGHYSYLERPQECARILGHFFRD